jgi:hypothetical protein
MQSFTCSNTKSFSPENLPVLSAFESIVRATKSRAIGFMLLSVVLAHMPAFGAGGLVLAWRPNTNLDVAGYNVYYGSACRKYTNVVCPGTATYVTVPKLAQGATYYFAVTAFTSSGKESLFSNELKVRYTDPLPTVLSIQPRIATSTSNTVTITTTIAAISNSWTLQSSSDLKTWATVKRGTNLPVNVSLAMGAAPNQFFRLVGQ